MHGGAKTPCVVVVLQVLKVYGYFRTSLLVELAGQIV